MRHVYCDGEPMIVALNVGALKASDVWCCLLCRRQQKSIELMGEHLRSDQHITAEAAARLKGRVTSAPNTFLRTVGFCQRALATRWEQIKDRFSRTAMARAVAVLLADSYLTLSANWSAHPLPNGITLARLRVHQRGALSMAGGLRARALRLWT